MVSLPILPLIKELIDLPLGSNGFRQAQELVQNMIKVGSGRVLCRKHLALALELSADAFIFAQRSIKLLCCSELSIFVPPSLMGDSTGGTTDELIMWSND